MTNLVLDHHAGVPDRLDDADQGVERKTATAVLLEASNCDSEDEEWLLRTFGDEAERDYVESKRDGGGEGLALFKYFKMELHRGGSTTSSGGSLVGSGGRKIDDVMATAVDNGIQLPLVYIVRLVLGYMKDQILKRLNHSDLTTIGVSDIHWVLTVPAIWSEFGKKFMRTAACRAGLIANEHNYEVRVAGKRRDLHQLIPVERRDRVDSVTIVGWVGRCLLSPCVTIGLRGITPMRYTNMEQNHNPHMLFYCFILDEKNAVDMYARFFGIGQHTESVDCSLRLISRLLS